jgi:hypothetical protein
MAGQVARSPQGGRCAPAVARKQDRKEGSKRARFPEAACRPPPLGRLSLRSGLCRSLQFAYAPNGARAHFRDLSGTDGRGEGGGAHMKEGMNSLFNVGFPVEPTA